MRRTIEPAADMSLRDIEKELGIDDALATEASEVTVRLDARRYGKSMTIIEGFDPRVDVRGLAKRLKHELGTGGTAKDHHIELQGDHADKARAFLRREGFTVR